MGKKEDNRDVFEKALDYAVPAAGAVAGGIVGRRLGGSKKRMMAERARGDDALKKRDRLVNNPNPKRGDVEEGMYQSQRANTAYYDAARIQDRRIGGAMIGGASGAAGGMILQDGNRPGKRRK